MEEKNWCVIEDGEWQTVLPNNDSQPHSKIVMVFPDGSKKAMVDDIECPCHPEIDWENKCIIHNAFDGRIN